ncbi:Aldo-keto reductase family 4 member C9 [Symbiodinium microadriaticum]|uniref:Aldo-keto reductase family 4 member C9 n=1 Tax=Symbiodinium microadriaticum TaxID=2951 RepID=A0A1Q9EZ42_SYMMI|nr:Aldo-keto reductase family 4 member C9 [Symbiodinium microadriaticum]
MSMAYNRSELALDGPDGRLQEALLDLLPLLRTLFGRFRACALICWSGSPAGRSLPPSWADWPFAWPFLALPLLGFPLPPLWPSFLDRLRSVAVFTDGCRERRALPRRAGEHRSVPPDAMGFEATWALVQRFAEEMPGGYADLCMVHWPNTAEQAPASVKDPELWSVLERVGTWKALEAAHDMGICKALGVSNFMLKHLQELQRYARVPPAVNQIEYSPTAPLTDVPYTASFISTQ